MERCGWVSQDPLYIAYHDNEWGVPETDSKKLFEMICLEGQQAGLSWITVLKKRENYRACFHQFDPVKVAAMQEEDVERLVQDAGIIRHRGKIQAIIGNARAYLQMEQNGEPWFVGKDVAVILGYTNPSKALTDHVDDEDKLNNETLSSLGQRGGWLINESGLYSLILSSKLPTARAFKRWVTSEVLPSLRKHGLYAADELLNNPDLMIEAMQALKAERAKNQQLNAKVQQDAPKVLFADSVTASHTSILVYDLAKLIRQNGVDIGGNRLFA